jgi:hypothetical protein
VSTASIPACHASLTTRTSQRLDEILQRTLSHAKMLLRSTISPQDYEILFPTPNSSVSSKVSNHSIIDVQRCLNEARASYEVRTGYSSDPWKSVAPTTTAVVEQGKGKAKARLWLASVSEKINHYGNVFDVLVQHHPEYTSLAWGTFKLLFIVSIYISLLESDSPLTSEAQHKRQGKLLTNQRLYKIITKPPLNSANPSPSRQTFFRNTLSFLFYIRRRKCKYALRVFTHTF